MPSERLPMRCPSWTEDVASQMRCDTACPVDAAPWFQT